MRMLDKIRQFPRIEWKSVVEHLTAKSCMFLSMMGAATSTLNWLGKTNLANGWIFRTVIQYVSGQKPLRI